MSEETHLTVPPTQPCEGPSTVFAGAPTPDLPPAITDKEADEAATALGMTFFSSAKTRQLKKVGMFRGQQNVVHLGVGRLAACDEALQQLITVAVEIAQDDQEDAERRIGAMMAGKNLVEVVQKGIAMEAEFQSEKLIGAASPKKRSFDTDRPIIPVSASPGSTININVDGGHQSGDTSKA